MRFIKFVAVALLCILHPGTAAAQAPAGSLNAVPPEDRARMDAAPPYAILPDDRVTFRFRAPQAFSVSVQGEWPGGLGGQTTVPMTRDAQGVWSVTAGPLPSDLWSYSFLVDGVTVQPTFGRLGEPPSGLSAGDIAIPGNYGSDFAPHGAPKGLLAYPYVPFMGAQRHLTVYTPPGYYEHPRQRYPVLYLTMGGRHDGVEGLGDTYIWDLLENLIAAGRARPMIVVVLDPQAPGGNSVGWTSFAGGGNQTDQRYVQAAQAIADEVVPWVDRGFRTLADREHRAIIGFSSPGAQGFLAGARNPETFANIGAFSGGFPTWPGVGVQIRSTLDPAQYSGPDLDRVPDMAKLGAMIPKLNASAHMRSVTLYVGTAEPLIQTQHLMTRFLDARGVRYVAIENPGQTHDARNIRVSLHDYLSRVFQ